MHRLLTTFLFISLIFTACTISTPTPGPPTQTATPTLIPPPAQGPVVLGDEVEIEKWEYLGPDAVELFPVLSANVRDVGNDVDQVRLVWKEDGFELFWITYRCSTQPVLVVHADATIEF
jgi:hypothetical protein